MLPETVPFCVLTRGNFHPNLLLHILMFSYLSKLFDVLLFEIFWNYNFFSV